jgi:hypothetical protein
MSKRGKGSKRYQPAPWSADFDALKKGGVAPWHRTKKGGKHPAGHKTPRGGGR